MAAIALFLATAIVHKNNVTTPLNNVPFDTRIIFLYELEVAILEKWCLAMFAILKSKIAAHPAHSQNGNIVFKTLRYPMKDP